MHCPFCAYFYVVAIEIEQYSNHGMRPSKILLKSFQSFKINWKWDWIFSLNLEKPKFLLSRFENQSWKILIRFFSNLYGFEARNSNYWFMVHYGVSLHIKKNLELILCCSMGYLYINNNLENEIFPDLAMDEVPKDYGN